MEISIAYLGGIASILVVLLAFYTIFINGRAIRKMLGGQSEMLREHGEMLREHGKTEQSNLDSFINQAIASS